ncbi:MAG: hypothetical protein HYV63_16430 [Candidatus Schekmanbacteria bacterium]|nr:hypothetical protein [Candidatus Schekmanbacteria bacterium]
MTHLLAVLQFALIYCPAAVIGLTVFGSDFKEVTGYLYLVPFAVGLLLWPALARSGHRVPRWAWMLLMLAGGAGGLAAYRPMHLGYWDEHSVTQAAGVAILGLASFGASVRAAFSPSGKKRLWHLPGALGIVACVWMSSLWYGMFPLAAVAVIVIGEGFAIWAGAPWTQQARFTGRRGFAFFLLFMAAVELFAVVWDYNVNPGWGRHVAVAWFAAAVGALGYEGLTVLRGRTARLAIGVACAAGVIAACLHPELVLGLEHTALMGAILGWAVTAYGCRRGTGHGCRHHAYDLAAVALPITLGVAVSSGLAQQLAFSSYRAVFLLALAGFAVDRWRRVRTHARAAEPWRAHPR